MAQVAATPAAQASILHADLDAFYASVEQLLDPSLRGKPIAVGGGVVLAASYEAKAFGVQGGMSGWRARQLCPGLQFVGGHFTDYQRLGDDVMGILYDFTPIVERISIDEAFLDVTGSLHLFGAPLDIARQLRRRVREEVGLPISVGAATTKHLAKVASQVAKPDGVVVVDPGREHEFLAPLPVELLWGVGPVTRQRLADNGIRTIGELAATSPSSLQGLLGRAIGSKLSALSVNDDPRQLETRRRAGSVGAQSALGRRRATRDVLRVALGHLADRVGGRLRGADRAGRRITVRVRFTDMRSVTRSTTFRLPTASTLTIADIALELAEQALADHPEEREITLVGISVSKLVKQPGAQLELPLWRRQHDARVDASLAAARWALDRTIDQLRDRFGRDSIGYAAVSLGDTGGVPDAFRELAEPEHRNHPSQLRSDES
jgi:DNA polymerase-4